MCEIYLPVNDNDVRCRMLEMKINDDLYPARYDAIAGVVLLYTITI